MSGGKRLSFLEKRELECSVCLERYKEPKTLQCLHSYCFQCLQNLIETQGKINCPKCCHTYDDLKKEDLKNLAANEMISNLVNIVEKIESEKASKCSGCHNKPCHYCQDCQLYLCGECIKHHKLIPILKDHLLYTLDEAEEMRDEKFCQTHFEYLVEFFCQTCNKRGCEKCQHVLHCYKNRHDVNPMKTAIDQINKNAAKVIKTIETIKEKLKTKLDISTKDRSNFESQLKLCRTAIEIQEKQIIKMVQEKTKKLMTDLEEIYKEHNETFDSQVKHIDSKLIKVNKVSISINTIMNKPEETETLRSHEATVNAVKDEVLGDEFDQSFTTKFITPTFISHTQLYEVIHSKGIGKITSVDGMFKVAEEDKSIIVNKEQPFIVKVSSVAESEAYQLAATLIHSTGEESAIEVEDQGNGEYRLKGRCNKEGDWKLKITVGAAHIKQSPVNVKVEKLGIVHIIDNIAEYKHNNKQTVADVVLGADGCILVSSFCHQFCKFNQLGLFVGNIQIPRDVYASKIHQMNDGCVVYSDVNLITGKCVKMCDETFQEIRSIGKGILKHPKGLTVNEKSRIMYVADSQKCCVFKFNVDDGRLLGKIGSKGNGGGQMTRPEDVTLTKDGHVIVADFDQSRIQMFDKNDNFIRTIIGHGREDGKVLCPRGITMDMDENLLISSNHKLQLFDKTGTFIKRIDNKNDRLNIPMGISVISSRPRRVAVANYGGDNVKIFNY